MLLACAFALEGGVLEKTAELKKEITFGQLRVLPIRMNPDLAMFGDQAGQELLKKTGAANLFTVFGEPDLTVDVARGPGDGRDPRAGRVRPDDRRGPAGRTSRTRS